MLATTTGETTITSQDRTESKWKNKHASCDIWLETEWDYSGRMGKDGKARK